MYLREIGQVKLLDAQREIELASAMERGTYLAMRRQQLADDFGGWARVSPATTYV